MSGPCDFSWYPGSHHGVSHPNNELSLAPSSLVMYKDNLLALRVGLRRWKDCKGVLRIEIPFQGVLGLKHVLVSSFYVCCFLVRGEGGGHRELRAEGGNEVGFGRKCSPNTAEHRGVVVGGCILQPAIHILILHALIQFIYIHLCPL